MNWMGKGLKGNKIVIETVLMVIFSFFLFSVTKYVCFCRFVFDFYLALSEYFK